MLFFKICTPPFYLWLFLLVLGVACGKSAATQLTTPPTIPPAAQAQPGAAATDAPAAQENLPTEMAPNSSTAQLTLPAASATTAAAPFVQVTQAASGALSQPSPTGDSKHFLDFGDLPRRYLLHIPPSYDPSQPTPLVLAFHGYGLDAEEMVRISGLSDLADAQGFLVAYPEGAGTQKSWNGGTCCGEAMMKKVDDVGFTRVVIEDIARQVNLDRLRVYATGFSNGAIMVYRLACELADMLAAIAPVSAAPAITSCKPARPISVIHFHGDADRLNPYDGGQRSGGGEFLPVENGIAFWVRANGCPSEELETQDGNIVHRVYTPCLEGSAVELYKILGGEHAWPGGEAVTQEIGVPSDEIDASVLMWEFFAARARP